MEALIELKDTEVDELDTELDETELETDEETETELEEADDEIELEEIIDEEIELEMELELELCIELLDDKLLLTEMEDTLKDCLLEVGFGSLPPPPPQEAKEDIRATEKKALIKFIKCSFISYLQNDYIIMCRRDWHPSLHSNEGNYVNSTGSTFLDKNIAKDCLSRLLHIVFVRQSLIRIM